MTKSILSTEQRVSSGGKVSSFRLDHNPIEPAFHLLKRRPKEETPKRKNKK